MQVAMMSRQLHSLQRPTAIFALHGSGLVGVGYCLNGGTRIAMVFLSW